MRQGIGANGLRREPSERRADHRADEARLGLLVERTYAGREARLTPADDALAKLNVALDAIGTPPQRQTDHRRLFGACALVALLLLLLSPVARFEFAGSTQHATRSAVTPMSGAVRGGVGIGTASAGIALPPVTVAASAGESVAPTERVITTIHVPGANGTAPVAGVSETPLRDLLARAGIHVSDPVGGSSTEGAPPQH